MELENFLVENNWIKLTSNAGVLHQAYSKAGWIVNLAGSYFSIRRFDRVVLVGEDKSVALGFLQEKRI